MTWTTTPPTVPGWYWTVFNDVEIVKVSRISNGRLVVGDDESHLPLSEFRHWYGPIPEPPQEPQP